MPAARAAAGFDRVVRLISEDLTYGFAFVRRDAGGHTVVGDRIADVGPDGLDERLDAIDVVRRAEHEEMAFFSGRRPWDNPEYPVHVYGYLRDRRGELVAGGASWTSEFTVTGWEVGLRSVIQRIRGCDPRRRVRYRRLARLAEGSRSAGGSSASVSRWADPEVS